MYDIQHCRSSEVRLKLFADFIPVLFPDLCIVFLAEYYDSTSRIFSLNVSKFLSCIICCPSDSTVSEDAGIEPRTVATAAMAVRRSNHSARSHPHV